MVRQLDLDPVPAGGLVIFQNSKAAPMASAIRDPSWRQAAASPTTLAVERLVRPNATALRRAGDRDDFVGPATGPSTLVLLAQQFDSHWRLDGAGSGVLPTRAFGWAVGFDLRAGSSGFEARFDGQASRSIEIVLLALLWMAGLWVTRRPARGR